MALIQTAKRIHGARVTATRKMPEFVFIVACGAQHVPTVR